MEIDSDPAPQTANQLSPVIPPTLTPTSSSTSKKKNGPGRRGRKRNADRKQNPTPEGPNMPTLQISPSPDETGVRRSARI